MEPSTGVYAVDGSSVVYMCNHDQYTSTCSSQELDDAVSLVQSSCGPLTYGFVFIPMERLTLGYDMDGKHNCQGIQKMVKLN